MRHHIALLSLVAAHAQAQNPPRHWTDAIDSRFTVSEPPIAYTLTVDSTDVSGFTVQIGDNLDEVAAERAADVDASTNRLEPDQRSADGRESGPGRDRAQRADELPARRPLLRPAAGTGADSLRGHAPARLLLPRP